MSSAIILLLDFSIKKLLPASPVHHYWSVGLEERLSHLELGSLRFLGDDYSVILIHYHPIAYAA